ncbi:hypothetical protein VSR34_27680 [Paraburkholderia sp. JHI2823]|uniref:hypothetical protein n=1 Tax=Paraburkholderia sp. JHI2823 TaxID=3112960 RepID=UPI00317034F1
MNPSRSQSNLRAGFLYGNMPTPLRLTGDSGKRQDRTLERSACLTNHGPYQEVRKMAVAYSTERERSTLEIIRTALRDAAFAPSDRAALDVAGTALLRLAELGREPAIDDAFAPFRAGLVEVSLLLTREHAASLAAIHAIAGVKEAGHVHA